MKWPRCLGLDLVCLNAFIKIPEGLALVRSHLAVHAGGLYPVSQSGGEGHTRCRFTGRVHVPSLPVCPWSQLQSWNYKHPSLHTHGWDLCLAHLPKTLLRIPGRCSLPLSATIVSLQETQVGFSPISMHTVLLEKTFLVSIFCFWEYYAWYLQTPFFRRSWLSVCSLHHGKPYSLGNVFETHH